MAKTQQIFNLSAPYNNQYQGDATRLVFVCSVGMLRSPTAAEAGIKRGYNCRSCGSDEVALIPLSANLIMWADYIIFLHNENREQSLKTFENTGYEEDIRTKGIVVGVEDDYNFGDRYLMIVMHHWLVSMENAGKLSANR